MYRPEKIKSIIKRIDDERAKGGTFKEIAEKLNKDKFPTIYGKKWSEKNLYNYYFKHK